VQANKQIDSYTQTNHVAVNRRNAHKLDIWGRQGQQKSCTVQTAHDSCAHWLYLLAQQRMLALTLRIVDTSVAVDPELAGFA